MLAAINGPKFYAWDKDGKPLAFGKLYTYKPSTNENKATYQSEDKLTANTNPVILNGEGYADVYLDGSYSVVLHDSDDNLIWSEDPVSQISGWSDSAAPNLCLNGGFTKGLPVGIPAIDSAAKDFWQGSGNAPSLTSALDNGIKLETVNPGGECKVLQKIPLTNELVQLINDNNGKLTVSTKLTDNDGQGTPYLLMRMVTNSIQVFLSSVIQIIPTYAKVTVSETFTAPLLVYNANDSYIEVGVWGIAGSSLDLEVNDFFKLEAGVIATPFIPSQIEKPFWREVAYNAPWEKNVNSTGLRYSKVGNQVTVYGRVQFIGVNSDRLIGTIPVGFRPLNSEVGAMYVDQFGTNFFTAVYVASDGTIKITEEASTPYNSTAVYFTNGLTFEVA